MISNVYSYYLSEYATKPSSRYDSHKKSELRGVYNKMVSVNKSTPLYKLNLSEDMQKLAIDIKESAIDLKDVASSLDDAKEELSEVKYKVQSSDEESVEVKYVGDNSSSDGELSFELDIKQLATNQINTGHYLQPGTKNLEVGTYSFDLSIEDVTYELQFNVDEQDTTKSLQDKISRLLNRSNIGVSAYVSNDAMGNTALNIESDKTGIRNMKPLIFKISESEVDTVAKHGAVEYFGLDRTMQYPANAIFAINGDVRSSANNQFTINKEFEINLKQPTSEPTSISLAEDNSVMSKEISNFVEGYNRVITFANNAKEKFAGGARLFDEFDRITKSYEETLTENGFKVDEAGYISLDEDDMSKFTDKEKVGDILNNLTDFRNSISRRVEKMIANPMEYVDKKVVAYKHPTKTFASPYSASAYAGIMFDGYY